ncbi:hypothetical protein B0T19DRAFT_398439 [Cercophora scortea]|uniref:Uncharacterized protein n=1 Tax=Cercophora scortea TaxID=314031 RepID=A0AAE0IWQ5_9PEZI|nr:hypothetical protein B0T19DRAFT_398439 [Cercophora scortea]
MAGVHHHTHSMTPPHAPGPYKAPLGPKDSRILEPIIYLVRLAPGHTLEKHSEAIGRDIQPYVVMILNMEKYRVRNQVLFTCQGVDDKMLDDIRLDPGVERVDYDGGWNLLFDGEN